VDSGADSAHDHDVGNCGDADSLFEETTGEDTASELLRGECFGVAEGTDPASVCIFEVDEEDFAAAPLDRNNFGSARRDTDGTAAASECFRRESGPDHARASQRSE